MIGRPTSEPSRSAGTKRHLADQRHVERLGQLVAAARAEQLVALAVVAGEPGHVLDDRPGPARFTFSAMNPTRWATFCAAGCGVVTTSTSLRGRNWDSDREMSPVPGRQIDQQVVGVVPVDVGEELLERLVQHRAPPDDRLVLLGEEAHGDAAHAVHLGRDEHLVDHHRGPVDARACAGWRSPTRRRR